MATIQAVNILTGTTEGVKYNATGITNELWTAALTTGYASGDVISGPTIPAGMYVTDVAVSVTDIDSATSALFTVGYSGAAAAFISSSSVGQTGGIARANVAGAIGFTATTNTTVLVTSTATAGTPVAGTINISVNYTASP
jgi:hypothetical protein